METRILTALWSSAAKKGAGKVLRSHSLSYLYTKDMLWSFKTYLWGIRVFPGIKETGCSNKFSAYLTPSRSTELNQQQLQFLRSGRSQRAGLLHDTHQRASCLQKKKFFSVLNKLQLSAWVSLCISEGRVALITIPTWFWICHFPKRIMLLINRSDC